MALTAYFDETGIHDGSKASAIAGFIGTTAAFDRAETAWIDALSSEDLSEFHYAPLEFRRGPFEGVDEFKRKRLKDKLATLLAEAAPELRAVGAGFVGIWDPNFSQRPGLQGRFPTSYSFCFEMLMEMLHSYASEELGGEQILPVFAQQQQHAPRALEMYGLFKETGSWPLMGPISFQEPTQRPALQMADMILYELYQVTKKGDREEWQKWPLLKRIWADDATYKKSVLFLIAHDPSSLRRAEERGPVPWGPGYKRAPEEPLEIDVKP